MESAVRTVCEPIFDRPLKDISFGRILLRLFEISRRFNMQIQPQLILLQKTLLNVEGLGRELYPELDIWSTASPILREWMRERTSLRSLLAELREEVPGIIAAARSLPALIESRLQRERAAAEPPPPGPALAELLAELKAVRRRDTLAFGALALVFAGLWLTRSGAVRWPRPSSSASRSAPTTSPRPAASSAPAPASLPRFPWRWPSPGCCFAGRCSWPWRRPPTRSTSRWRTCG